MKIFVKIFFLFLLCSCIHCGDCKKEYRINEDILNTLLSKGHIENLITNDDTLQVLIDLSSCIHKRYDKINFYRKADTLYIQPEITVAFDKEKIVQGLEKKYSLPQNNTLSFEYLIGEIHKTLPNKQDSPKQKTRLISIGVRKKWGLNYFSEKMTAEYFRLINTYLRIMNRIYPEIDEYKPTKIQLIDN